MAKSKQETTSNKLETSLANLDKELKELGDNAFYNAFLAPIRNYIKLEFAKAIKQFKQGVVSDFSQEIDTQLEPLMKLVDRIPNKFLKDGITKAINDFKTKIQSEVQASI